MVKMQLERRGIQDKSVLAAMSAVPRHLFIPEQSAGNAYADGPLSIGYGQTISQPYMVALMTECLLPLEGLKVLEIGTGSGYQTAILSFLGAEVFTVERIGPLAEQSQRVLIENGFTGIHFKVGDGTHGWREHVLYDRIIVTAGAPSLPICYQEQLVDGGKIVIPLGSRFFQSLKIFYNHRGELQERTQCDCYFVQLIGEDGWGEIDE